MDYRLSVVNSKSHAGLSYYCPSHVTGVKLPDGFVQTPIEYVG